MIPDTLEVNAVTSDHNWAWEKTLETGRKRSVREGQDLNQELPQGKFANAPANNIRSLEQVVADPEVDGRCPQDGANRGFGETLGNPVDVRGQIMVEGTV